MVTAEPYDWKFAREYKPAGTLTELGDLKWGDYQVTADVLVEDRGYAQVIAHLNAVPGNSQGYCLRLSADGTWQFLVSGTVSAQGNIAGRNQWHKLQITCKGSSVVAEIDDRMVAQAKNTIATGMVGSRPVRQLGSPVHQSEYAQGGFVSNSTPAQSEPRSNALKKSYVAETIKVNPLTNPFQPDRLLPCEKAYCS